MQTSVRQTASRLAIQAALQRYYDFNNDTTQNWSRAKDDFNAVFTGDGDARLLVQARVYRRNTSEFGVLNITKDNMQGLVLPYSTPDGSPALFGDDQNGFIPELYPRFDPFTIPINSSFRQTKATYNGRLLDAHNFLLSGPYHVNDTLSLISITMPIINNTSSIDTLGWLTAVLDANLVQKVVNALEGLQDSGLTMVCNLVMGTRCPRKNPAT